MVNMGNEITRLQLPECPECQGLVLVIRLFDLILMITLKDLVVGITNNLQVFIDEFVAKMAEFYRPKNDAEPNGGL